MFAVNALHCLERGLLKVLELCSTVGFGAPNPGSDIVSENPCMCLITSRQLKQGFISILVAQKTAGLSADNSIVGKYFFSCPKMNRSFSSTSVSCQLESC